MFSNGFFSTISKNVCVFTEERPSINLSESDTSDSFSIYDGIGPEISVTGPTSDFSVPEYNNITVTIAPD